MQTLYLVLLYENRLQLVIAWLRKKNHESLYGANRKKKGIHSSKTAA